MAVKLFSDDFSAKMELAGMFFLRNLYFRRMGGTTNL